MPNCLDDRLRRADGRRRPVPHARQTDAVDILAHGSASTGRIGLRILNLSHHHHL